MRLEEARRVVARIIDRIHAEPVVDERLAVQPPAELVAQVYRRRIRGSVALAVVREGREPVTFSSLSDFLSVLRTSGYRSVEAKSAPGSTVRCACAGRCGEGRADYVVYAIPPLKLVA
jgi:hypothetical protein